jgi:ankyrin repeat protein
VHVTGVRDAARLRRAAPARYEALHTRYEALHTRMRFSLTLTAPRAQSGDTPLHQAAYEGHLECVRALVDGHADKEAKDYVRALLYAASARGSAGLPHGLSLCSARA